jgi:hypothetical protein
MAKAAAKMAGHRLLKASNRRMAAGWRNAAAISTGVMPA